MSIETAGAPTRTSQMLCDAFLDLYPAEAALNLETAPVEEIVDFMLAGPPSRASRLLERLSPTLAARCLVSIGQDGAGRALTEMSVHRAALLLGQLDAATREGLLEGVEKRLAGELRESLSYPPETAGQLMDTQILALAPGLAVGQALDRVRTLGRARTQYIWVVDESERMLGRVSLAEAVLADPAAPLGEVVTPPVARIHAVAPREDVVDLLSTSGADAIPVVDLDDRLLGIIRSDALVRAAQEEAMTDLQKMVGVSKDERALSPALFAVRKRLPWLNINLLTAFLAAAVVGIFESTIAQFTALAVLLPVVAGQSGNTGAQALAVTMRGLALREIRLRHARGVLIKETLVGALNGVAVAVVTAVGVYFWSGSLGLTMVIAMAMTISMILAGLSGAAIPLILSAMRQDPAQSGSIILTTVTDVTGFFSFLGLATLFSAML